VQKRTLDCIDFIAVEARYHAACRLRFQSQRLSKHEPKAKKKACVINQSIDQQIQRLLSDSSFTHFIADNVDHTIVTFIGKGSFHGMGIIASTVDSRDHIIKEIKIKRTQKLLKVDELVSKASSVPIIEWNFSGQ